jgi:hypothetical protein
MHLRMGGSLRTWPTALNHGERVVRHSDGYPVAPRRRRATNLPAPPIPSQADQNVNEPERQHPRFAHECAVRVRFGAKETEGRTRNVSRGGLCANVGSPVPVGSDITIEINLVFDDGIESESLTLGARIAWCTTLDDEFQVGVSFKNVTKDQADFLNLFLKYLGEERAQKPARVEKSIDDQFG